MAATSVPTTAADLLARAFAALPPAEQDEAFAGIQRARLVRMAFEETETASLTRALRRATELVGADLTAERYRLARRRLAGSADELPDLGVLVRHFGSWREAREAVGLADTTTTKKIEARFEARRHGRARVFGDEELAASLKRCRAAYGRIPLLSEYSDWRERELALGRLRGEATRVPGAGAFRRRYGSWEAALRAQGFSDGSITARLEPLPERAERLAKVDRYTEATLQATLERCARELGHAPLSEEYDAWRERVLNRTRRRGVVLPSNSPYRRRYGTWERALLHFGYAAEDIAARRTFGRNRSSAAVVSFRFRAEPTARRPE